MHKNVIILTSGQSGSSVLTGLIVRAGFWCGDETKTVGYDTFENSELVDLDREILAAAGVGWGWTDLVKCVSDPPVQRFRELAETFEVDRRKAFLERCSEHRPWIWKDPRLAHTIHFWEPHLQVDDCAFLIMGRDSRQSWTGHMTKGKQPVSFDLYSAVQQGLVEAAFSYVRSRALPCLSTTFEELLLSPRRVLGQVNEFLGTSLTMDDLEAAYHDPLGELRYGPFDHMRAWARYQAHRWVLRDVVAR